MKKMIFSLFVAVMAILGVGGVSVALMTEPVQAQVMCPDGSEKAEWGSCSQATSGLAKSVKSASIWTTVNKIINVVCGVMGTVLTVLIVVGGVQFATSQGDAAKTTKARNTILYGVIGLVIVMLAFAIVNFVLSNVFGSSE